MPLTSRVGRVIRLSPAERALLHSLQSDIRAIKPGRKLLTKGQKSQEIFIVLSGMGMRYRVLNDGRRQISRFVMPEDIIGYGALTNGSALFSTLALTEMVVASISHADLMRVLQSKPRLLVKVLMSFSSDASIDAERLVDLGRRLAIERIAHFLVEFLMRLQNIGLANEHPYKLPLTRELLSDALGLSVTHVNRVFQRLREENLVRVVDQRVVIEDVRGLSALADFDPTYLQPRLPSDLFDNVA
jgi:CRP-like cAMP-binding protein